MPLYIITNASTLNEENLTRLLPYMNNLTLQLSFDGDNEKTHAITRGTQNFKQLIECINFFVNHGLMQHIIIRYNIMFHNYKEISSFVQYMSSFKCQTIAFSYILPQGRGSALKEINENIKKEISLNVTSLQKRYNNINISIKQKPVITCPYALTQKNQIITFSPRVDSEGNVYPCQVEVDSKFIIGNLYTQSMKDILNSHKLKNYFLYVTNKKERISQCRKCVFSYICGGGCVALPNACEQMKKTMLHDFLH